MSQSSVDKNKEKARVTLTDDKQNCFFDSLHAYETDKQTKTTARKESKQTSSKFNAYSPIVEERKHTAVKKKFKIVRPKPQPENVGEKKESITVIAITTDVKKDPPPSSSAGAKAYLTKAMKILGAGKFREITGAVKQYKKDNDLQPLLLCMVTILLEKKEYFEIYLGFSNYLSESDRKIYLQKYVDITGEDIPEEYEKRKRSDKMEASMPYKKIRTDS